MTLPFFPCSIGCCFITYYTRTSALEAQNALHNMKILPGVGKSAAHWIRADTPKQLIYNAMLWIPIVFKHSVSPASWLTVLYEGKHNFFYLRQTFRPVLLYYFCKVCVWERSVLEMSLLRYHSRKRCLLQGQSVLFTPKHEGHCKKNVFNYSRMETQS